MEREIDVCMSESKIEREREREKRGRDLREKREIEGNT